MQMSPEERQNRKNELTLARDQYRSDIENQVKDIKERAFTVGKTVAIVGIAFAGIYLIFDTFFGEDEKKKSKKVQYVDNQNLPVLVREEDSDDSGIIGSIKGYILAFLIGVAREKIKEALAYLTEQKESQ
jgi:hypothetical protein